MLGNNYRKNGEVSLFVVIFSTLLLTIVTVSFIRIMLNNQQQASTIDLSQSAYDSAQAGVEDAKRAILYYQSVCGDPSKTTKCDEAKLAAPKCNASVNLLSDISAPGGPSSAKEIQVQNGSTGNSLDQAYTCTTIAYDTKDYVNTLTKDSSDTIPLLGVVNPSDPLDTFDTVQISWFKSTDYPSNLALSIPTVLPNNIPLSANWVQNKPPVLRAQLIQYGSNGFSLNELNDINGSGESNSNTLFLYPTTTVGTTGAFATDSRRASPGSPYLVNCNTTNIYACTVKLPLPKPVHDGTRTAFLRIGALYNQATFQVQLIKSGSVVNFNGVEPTIDSTGRANDLFRRVQARVKLSSDFTYPNAEIYTSGNLCKNFLVTDSALPGGGYDPGTCTP